MQNFTNMSSVVDETNKHHDEWTTNPTMLSAGDGRLYSIDRLMNFLVEIFQVEEIPNAVYQEEFFQPSFEDDLVREIQCLTIETMTVEGIRQRSWPLKSVFAYFLDTSSEEVHPFSLQHILEKSETVFEKIMHSLLGQKELDESERVSINVENSRLSIHNLSQSGKKESISVLNMLYSHFALVHFVIHNLINNQSVLNELRLFFSNRQPRLSMIPYEKLIESFRTTMSSIENLLDTCQEVFLHLDNLDYHNSNIGVQIPRETETVSDNDHDEFRQEQLAEKAKRLLESFVHMFMNCDELEEVIRRETLQKTREIMESSSSVLKAEKDNVAIELIEDILDTMKKQPEKIHLFFHRVLQKLEERFAREKGPTNLNENFTEEDDPLQSLTGKDIMLVIQGMLSKIKPYWGLIKGAITIFSSQEMDFLSQITTRFPFLETIMAELSMDSVSNPEDLLHTAAGQKTADMLSGVDDMNMVTAMKQLRTAFDSIDKELLTSGLKILSNGIYVTFQCAPERMNEVDHIDHTGDNDIVESNGVVVIDENISKCSFSEEDKAFIEELRRQEENIAEFFELVLPVLRSELICGRTLQEGIRACLNFNYEDTNKLISLAVLMGNGICGTDFDVDSIMTMLNLFMTNLGGSENGNASFSSSEGNSDMLTGMMSMLGPMMSTIFSEEDEHGDGDGECSSGPSISKLATSMAPLLINNIDKDSMTGYSETSGGAGTMYQDMSIENIGSRIEQRKARQELKKLREKKKSEDIDAELLEIADKMI